MAVLAGGGVALAAETGHLPAGAQHHAHRLFSAVGVPAPAPETTSERPTTVRPSTAGPTTAHPAPSAPPSPKAPGGPPSEAPNVRGLCQAWAAQQEPHGKPMKGKSRQALIAAAGGEDRVTDFCVALLGTPTTTPAPGADPDRKPDHTGKPTATPGNGKGHGQDRTRPPGPKDD
ncbi:hypothetical protein AB0M36_35700 [Actinoplanes sp. NPDC051346]|uniref:hypothetical protein n=1 Tax=Actinoplanes sp. NPDC051346 TaxID=3155048 RepID=UPI00342C4988